MFRLFECCALSFFERFVLSLFLKIERFVSDSAEIWICGLYCESIAQTIAEKLGVASVDVIDASKITTEKVESYDILLLGTSTWGDGELQDDWYDAIKMIRTADLNGKIVALFGCGDSESYCDTFCDGMGVIYDQLKNSGCTFVGAVSADGYSYSSSIAIIDGKFVGLALDDVNESGKTEERINSWVEEIKKNL